MMMFHKLDAIRWNWVLAALCLALMAWFRTDDGRIAPGMLLAAAAMGAALMALSPGRFTGRTAPPGGDSESAPHHPDRRQVERTLRWYRTRHKMWLATMVFGWAIAILGVFVFPPLALVAAAIAAYAVARYRRVHAYTRTLAAVLEKLPC